MASAEDNSNTTNPLPSSNERIVKLDVCSACGNTANANQNSNLKRCQRCCSVAYCNRNCQRKHWKTHKATCDQIVANMERPVTAITDDGSGSSSGTTTTINNEVRKEHERMCKKQAKTMRKAKRDGSRILSLSDTAFGMVGPGLPIPAGVPRNFPLKQAATIELQMGPARKTGKLGNFAGESSYRDYYNELVSNKDEWMTFFNHEGNITHSEHTCGILGTLATIYRQRGNLKECEEVLDLEVEVLDIFRRSALLQQQQQQQQPSNQTNVIGPVYVADCLEYKMNMIRNNLCLQLGRYTECIQLFRKVAGHEVKYNLPFEDQEFLFMIGAILLKPPTGETLRTLTDDEVMSIVLAPLRGNMTAEEALRTERTRVVELKTCTGCGKKEESCSELFKQCSICKNAYYHNREYQKKDWKRHKKVCRGSA